MGNQVNKNSYTEKERNFLSLISMINIYYIETVFDRASKKLFYQSFFNKNLSNMKKTWEGILELIGRQKK